MRIYQDTLPPPSWSGFSLSPTDQSLRTDMEVGDPKVRRLTYAKRDVADVMLRMKDVEYSVFRAWFGDDAYSLSGDSDDVSTWGLSGVTMVTDVEVGPDGQLCDRIIQTATTGVHRILRNANAATLPANRTVVARATLKGLGCTYAWIGVMGFDSVSRYAVINLSTGQISATSGIISASVKARGNGWYRLEVVCTTATGAATGTSFRIHMLDATGVNGSFTGDGVSGIAVCEQQLRVQTGADLHMPTDASGNVTGAGGGSAWFQMPMPLGNGLTPRQCQFIGTYAAKGLAGLNWQITAKLRLR